MTMAHERHRETEPANIEYALERLQTELPAIAKELAHYDPAFPLDQLLPEEQKREQEYVNKPDSVNGHSPRWHQYGFLTHSEKFREFIAAKVPTLMETWGMTDMVTDVLSQEIDGVSKINLLQIASLLHDIGKPVSRYLKPQEDGTTLASFDEHEKHSYDIIKSDLVRPHLVELHLTDAQIEYIAQCAKYHFELGKARKEAIDRGDKNSYTLAFARSSEFKDVARGIINTHPDYALEIGLMFMADSYSKTVVAADADTDEGIRLQKDALEQEIKEKDLNPRLINQALQQPVNVEIGKQYLLVLASVLSQKSDENISQATAEL